MRKKKTKNTSKLDVRMGSSIRRRNGSLVARRVAIIGVVVSSLMVIFTIILTTFFNSEAIAHRKFEKLAKEYYEEYYYGRFIETIDESVFDTKMKTFEETGLQPVTLRQLLLYQNGKNQAYKKYFATKDFNCDKNTTTAQFFPVYPYGVKDYTVEYKYSCQED